MCGAWRGQDPRIGGGWHDVDINNFNSDRRDPQRNNGTGSELFKIGAFDKLWGKDGFYELLRARSRTFRQDFNDLNGSIFRSHQFSKDHLRETPLNASKYCQQASNTEPPQAGQMTQFGADTYLESEIDPITNRKVYKKPPLDDTRDPIDVPVKTFKSYRSQFSGSHSPKANPSSTESKPRMNTDQGGRPTLSHLGRDYLQDYEGAETYKPYFAYEPDGKKFDLAHKGLSDFDSQVSYKRLPWFISAGTTNPKSSANACMVQESLKDYDNRTSYVASPWNEPENKVADETHHCDSARQGLKDFDSIACYGPLKSTRDKKTETMISGTNEGVEQGLKDFDKKTTYGPVLHNEPDGKLPTQPDVIADGLHDFDIKADYGQSRILKNMSQNRKNSETDESSWYQNDIDTREDLDLLRPSDVRAASGIIKAKTQESKEEKIAKRRELEEDFENTQQIEASYANGDPAVKRQEENRQLLDARSKKDTARRLTGNFIRDFPEEFETNWTAAQDVSWGLSPKRQTDTWGYDKESKGLELSYQQEIENDTQRAEKAYIEGRAPREAFARNSDTPRLQTSLDRTNWQEQDKPAVDILGPKSDPYFKRPQGLETSYVDECKFQAELDPYSKEPQGLELSYAEECSSKQGEENISVSAASLGSPKGKDMSGDGRSDSNLSISNEAFNDVALVGELRRIYEEKYGKIDLTHRQVPGVSTSPRKPRLDGAQAARTNPEVQETVAYKILAYDPVMQQISIAETTSVIADTASPLTPAEVLVKLSNPAKFFPHFQSLQAEGYEIASGSGDILVFRKAQSAGPRGTKSEPSSSIIQDRRKTTNPIDGMQGKPIAATGNFASPTGFVNYDRPISSEPGFKSNIDVRREEPVFSGRSSWADGAEDRKQKKPSLWKRVLLGGAMVGSCSYAIGVVAEYFKSGGADGLGPQTF